MVRQPYAVKANDSLETAVDLMERYQVWDMPVTDDNKILVGLLHLHPAVKALLK